ncbi:hypothetical protein PSACC_01762 [Paramicrosporidium saccamoebae]|uniref:RNB domain-containing protein n=1 Tax=Paramicrosporidium saccamoebae TaxID=1246581 RepID=A0A2H9TKZ3_9FUNG|nr:hypothetical protein PSACC_01762 [Paramicrosporidium saccamoebae]
MLVRQLSIRALTEPVPLRPLIQWGNVVEFTEFGGNVVLGLVTSTEKSQDPLSNPIEVLKSNGHFKSVEANFLRFTSKLLSEKPAEGIDRFTAVRVLKKFEDKSRSILSEQYRSLEDAVAKQASSAIQKPLGEASLFYESDLAVSVFGNAPKPEELYATHLYLHSYTEKFGRDSMYRPQCPAHGNAQSSAYAAGPYFLRCRNDMKLLNDMKQLVNDALDLELRKTDWKKNTNIIYRFRRALQSAKPKTTDGVLTQPEFEPILNLIDKAVICGWHDSAWNPFFQFASNVLQGIEPLVNLADLTSFYRKYNLEGRLLEIDVPKHQSGLGFSAATTSFDDVASFPGIDTEESSVFSGRTQFDNLAIAIDSESTIEVDDAISIQTVGDQVWLHVHVADPARVISCDSVVDLQARSLSSTLYLPQNSYFMLPLEIGMKASLDPKKKYNGTITFSARLGSDGDIADYRVSQGVVTHLRRITPDQCNELLQSDTLEGTVLKNISSLISGHLRYREKQGIVNCNIPSSKVTVWNQGPMGPTLQVTLDDRQDDWSSTLVTECMVIAGRVAALFAQDRKLSVPFRYHLDPSEEGGEEFLRLLDIVRENGSEASLYDRLKLASFFKASAVDIHPRPHWGLGLASYVKATSPLRRYFDLLLHHQISLSLDANTQPKSAEYIEAIIPTVYRHEQYLKKLERSSRRFWTIRYIEQLLCGQSNEWMPLKILRYVNTVIFLARRS